MDTQTRNMTSRKVTIPPHMFYLMKMDSYGAGDGIIDSFTKINHAIVEFKKAAKLGEAVEIWVMDNISGSWIMGETALMSSFPIRPKVPFKIFKHCWIGEPWINLLWPSSLEDTKEIETKSFYVLNK